MRKRIFAAVCTVALAVFSVFSVTTEAKAVTYSDAGEYSNGTVTQDNPQSASTDIDVKASTTGGGDIVFSVDIEWGAMDFSYDYGNQWDPVTHSYTSGVTGKQNGGWDVTKLDGDNNKISVTNNSNYPIVAEFSYANLSTSTFNQTPSATEVKGLFDMSNSSLKTKVANQSDTSTITYPVSLPLNTCTTNIQSGEYYYYQGTDDGSYQNNIYFSLMGTPDRSLSLNQDSVGNITVTIKPAGSTTKVTKS